MLDVFHGCCGTKTELNPLSCCCHTRSSFLFWTFNEAVHVQCTLGRQLASCFLLRSFEVDLASDCLDLQLNHFLSVMLMSLVWTLFLCPAEKARLNFYLLVMNSVRVVFTKCLAFNTILTIRTMLFWPPISFSSSGSPSRLRGNRIESKFTFFSLFYPIPEMELWQLNCKYGLLQKCVDMVCSWSAELPVSDVTSHMFLSDYFCVSFL